MAKSKFYEIRKAIAPGSTCPVVIVPGRWKPKLTGEGWHYRTKTGIRIYHPAAYAKKGWSTMVYHDSTRRIEVGREWVIRHAPQVVARIAAEKMTGRGAGL